MAVPDLKDAIEHLQRKDLDAAIAALERKIEELPAHLTAHVLLARTYEANHQWRKALTCWENVRFLMPNSPVGQDGKARTLRRLTREGDAADDDAPASEETPPPAETPSEPDASPAAEADETSEADPEANAEEPPSSSDAPPDELQKLRQQAEAEARSGGARPDLAGEAAASADEPAPEERVGQLEDEDDLDHLIEQLESARIEPDPDAEGEVPPPDLDDEVDDLVSETLARIHEAQDQYRKAAQIYLKLASQEPDRAREHLEKAAKMREKADLDD